MLNPAHSVGGPLKHTNTLFLLTVLPINFITISESWDYYCGVLVAISIPLIPSIFIIWNSSVRKILLFCIIYVYNYLLYQYGLMNLFFILWAIIQYYIYIFTSATGSSFSLPLMSFWHAPSFILNMSLLSGTTWGFRIILSFPWLRPRTSHFCQEPWLLLLGNGIWEPRSGFWVSSLLLGYHCFSRESKEMEMYAISSI